MAKSIEEYVEELRRELAGCDPALIQDALYDAEEFLRNELEAAGEGAPEEILSSVIERYGSPAEVARAYIEAELHPRPALAAQARVAQAEWELPKQEPLPRVSFFGVIIEPRAYASLFYMLLSFVTGIIYFNWVIIGVSLSLGLLILIIGIPIALLFLATTRAISLAEGWIIEGLLGIRMPRRPRAVVDKGSWLERIKFWFTDYRTWTTLLYMILMLPLGIIYFCVAITLLTLSLSLIAAPFLQWILAIPVMHFNGWGYYLAPWMMPFAMALGAVLFFCTLHLARWTGRMHGLMAKHLLVGSL